MNRYKGLLFLVLLIINSVVITAFANPMHTVIIIRHAERANNDDLTPQGLQRAKYFSSIWKDETINKIYSTNYKRTQLTVLPLSELKNVPITFYDSNYELFSFLQEDLKKLEAQKIVIVGHSNTLAEIVKFLGGPILPEIGENEFDHLYIVMKSTERSELLNLHY